jgi:tripartite-type tricarboxylate transporter receptor subunit TctC
MGSSNEIVAFLSVLFLGCAVTHAANASVVEQDYPDKPVHIIEPFGLGGGPDLLARTLAAKLSELWGQPVIVENHPGAGATAGPAQVARSRPDGYTLLINTSAQAYSAAFLKNLPYEPLKDFIPVAALTSQPYVLVAGKRAGIATVGELIAAAKAKPNELKFGSTGPGTGTHLGVVKFNLSAGIKAVDVPPQPTDAIADIVAGTIEGHVTYVIAPISITLPAIRDGRLLPLGVTTARRSTLLPQVPTIAEAGVAGFDFPIWYGMWVPAGTPASVVDKLSKDFERVLAGPDLRDWITKHGGEPMSMTQSAFARFVQGESESAAQLINSVEIKPRNNP